MLNKNIFICLLGFIIMPSFAVTLEDISNLKTRINLLVQENDKGIRNIPPLVLELNQAEADLLAEASQPASNSENLALLEQAILEAKLGLSNYVYNQKLYLDVQNAMISLGEGTNKNAMAHKSITLNISLLGPTTKTVNYMVNYLNSDEAGGLKLREVLMYLTHNPPVSIKSRISFLASEKGHPIFRGPASWIFGQLSAKDDDEAIAQLTKALEQSIVDNYGFDTIKLNMLGLAEIASHDYIQAKFINNIYLDESILNLGKRYANYIRQVDTADYSKAHLIKQTFSIMGAYERDEVINYMLSENEYSLFLPYYKLNLIRDGDKGLIIDPMIADLVKILGYTITGTSDNPIITKQVQ